MRKSIRPPGRALLYQKNGLSSIEDTSGPTTGMVIASMMIGKVCDKSSKDTIFFKIPNIKKVLRISFV
jgi:hypothetical protein